MVIVWSAKSFSDEDIPENTEVEIVDIDGVKAVVKKITDKITASRSNNVNV